MQGQDCLRKRVPIGKTMTTCVDGDFGAVTLRLERLLAPPLVVIVYGSHCVPENGTQFDEVIV